MSKSKPAVAAVQSHSWYKVFRRPVHFLQSLVGRGWCSEENLLCCVSLLPWLPTHGWGSTIWPAHLYSCPISESWDHGINQWIIWGWSRTGGNLVCTLERKTQTEQLSSHCYYIWISFHITIVNSYARPGCFSRMNYYASCMLQMTVTVILW